LIYALLAIFASNNFGLLMELLGNQTNQYYYSQYRASLMLGSTITVSYYLVLSLPICLFLNFTSSNKRWKRISFITILSVFIAIAILGSRISFIISVFIMSYYMLFVKNNNGRSYKKVALIIVLILLTIFAYDMFDLSRIFSGFSDNSTSSRISAMKLGMYIFSQNPVIGSGLGKYFTRIYSERIINVDGIFGLVDPHNLYILILSELGFVGLALFLLIIIVNVGYFKYINNPILRKTAYMVIVVALLSFVGGSQLFNEISYSVIFWSHFSLFKAIGRRDHNKSLLKVG
jgi:O-antigen ligase